MKVIKQITSPRRMTHRHMNAMNGDFIVRLHNYSNFELGRRDIYFLNAGSTASAGGQATTRGRTRG